jgi:hypothetical protein
MDQLVIFYPSMRMTSLTTHLFHRLSQCDIIDDIIFPYHDEHLLYHRLILYHYDQYECRHDGLDQLMNSHLTNVSTDFGICTSSALSVGELVLKISSTVQSNIKQSYRAEKNRNTQNGNSKNVHPSCPPMAAGTKEQLCE